MSRLVGQLPGQARVQVTGHVHDPGKTHSQTPSLCQAIFTLEIASIILSYTEPMPGHCRTRYTGEMLLITACPTGRRSSTKLIQLFPMRLQVTPRRPSAHSMASQRHRLACHHQSTVYAPTSSFQNLSNPFSPALTACFPYIKVQTAENLYFWAVRTSSDATGYYCRRFAVECV